jgi:hypothetical protein
MESLWEIIAVYLLSTVKFVFGGVPMALGLGFPFFKTVTITSLGGFTGVTFFVLMSDKLITYLKKRNALQHPQNHLTKKIFTRRNKIIVKVKHRYGLPGIALLTPSFLSIPIGCFIAVRYFKNKHQILIYMFGAVLFWSVFISSFKFLFR